MKALRWLSSLLPLLLAASVQAQGAAVTAFGLRAGDPAPPAHECRPEAGFCRMQQASDWGLPFNRVDVQSSALAGVCSLRAEHEIPISRPSEVTRFIQRLLARWHKQLGEPLWGQDDVSQRLLTDPDAAVPGSPQFDGRGAGNQLFHALWRLDAREAAATGIRLVDALGYVGPSAERPQIPGARADALRFDTARIALTVHFAQSAECAAGCDPVGQRVLPEVVGGVMRWRCLSQRGAALVPGFNWAWQIPELGSLDYVLMVGPDAPRDAAQRAPWHFVRIDATDYAARQFEAGLGEYGQELKREAGRPVIAKRVVVSGRTSLGDRFRIYIALAAQPDEQGRHGYALVFKCFSGPCSEGQVPAMPFVLTHLPRDKLTPVFNQLDAAERRRRIGTMVD